MGPMLAGAVAAYNGLGDAHMQQLVALPPVIEFMQQLSQGELSRLRILSINRGRGRRRLRHYLADWAPLQVTPRRDAPHPALALALALSLHATSPDPRPRAGQRPPPRA